MSDSRRNYKRRQYLTLAKMNCLILTTVVLAGMLRGLSGENSGKWDNLRVTWGRDFSSSDLFQEQPRTVDAAVGAGWKKIDDCDTSAKWRGARYIKDDDYAVVLLFDVKGTIAGIQTAIPTDAKKGYPKKNIIPPFVKYDDDRNVITAYFVKPSTICTTGRTEADLENVGTGTTLYLQVSENPEESVAAPATEKEALQASDKWIEGKCVPTMGKHFYGKNGDELNCDDIFPVFLMYNGGKLNAFGWVLLTDSSSPRYEHPPKAAISMTMNNPPACLFEESRPVSTMHIYMTNNPVRDNNC